MPRLFLTLTLILAGCATTPQERAAIARDEAATEAKLAAALKGFAPAGPPQTCINERRQTYNTTTIGDTILYRFGRDEIFVNRAPGCNGAGRGDALVLVNYQAGLLCAGQIIRTVDVISRVQTGSCALGDFTPYKRVKS
ncbi:MAG: hypothetical protein A4S12_12450 [Proteobacteria bacterium SG_bin5]|nr:hypothetical protein [Sphingomonas sp.]OQW38616.1 MAG: hypothetical protein A4S12_12450 [Proteobacteria bacterium SG_bin5]